MGEVVGTENRGLSADTIASLPLVNYKTGGSQTGSNDSYVCLKLLVILCCSHVIFNLIASNSGVSYAG